MKLLKPILFTGMLTICSSIAAVPLSGTAIEENGIKPTAIIVNINTADIEALMALPGIGRLKAEAIVKFRDTHGDFQSIQDITLVKGIGEKLFERIDDKIEAQ